MLTLTPLKPPPTSAMPCAACGRWARGYRWYSEMRFEGPDQTPSGPHPRWQSWYQDPADPRLYWILKCAPTCAANELPAKLDDAEQALLREARDRHMRELIVRQFRELRLAANNSLDELSEAWLVFDS